jgi:predicted dithiol-disulfide oxidoreductase (DUF899 family)
MKDPAVVSWQEWRNARLELLEKEKAHSRARDQLTQARQTMPWVAIEKDYEFEGPRGHVLLANLFQGKSQLIVYHFMFDTDWEEGCKSCSFIADHLEPALVHIANRDVAFAMISKAPWQKLEAFRKRMGWTLEWISSAGNTFNRDFHVSFTDEELEAQKAYYNFREGVPFPVKEAPGISVFARDERGRIFHTYSAYARGLENFIGAYTLLDIVPKGRDEDGLVYGMEWLRHKDRYDDDGFVDPYADKL